MRNSLRPWPEPWSKAFPPCAGRSPVTANGFRQPVTRRGRQAGFRVHPHRFRHRFSHTRLDRADAEGDLMELNGWASPQMLLR